MIGHNPVTKLHQIVYDNNDTKQNYYNEVRDQRKRLLTKRRQWKKPKLAKIHYLHSKYAPKESDNVERSIASLRSNVNISTEDVPIEMIQIAINTL